MANWGKSAQPQYNVLQKLEINISYQHKLGLAAATLPPSPFAPQQFIIVIFQAGILIDLIKANQPGILMTTGMEACWQCIA